MKSLTLKGITKTFPINKTDSFTALSNINLSFEEAGFVAITGKSGSGKTTLLNMISKFDKPTKGEIYLYKKKYSYKHKKNYLFFRNDIGLVSQHYNLLTDLTVLDNVALPLFISGYSKNKSYSKAYKYLNYVGISKDLYEVKASKLSGGESQRVAIARALIRSPKIILCDEPTGALDSDNSIKVMELLSKISKSVLVIIVSHNLPLVNSYCNRIIEIKDGKIINDYTNKKFDLQIKEHESNLNGHYSWTSKFSFKNYLKRIRRNLFVVAALSGFINGKESAIRNACYEQLDFGYGTISKDELVSDTGFIKLTKSIRPDLNELLRNDKITNLFNISPNFSAILPQNIKISFDEVNIEGIQYTPIYSFLDRSFDSSLIHVGEIPLSDNLGCVFINRKCYDIIKEVVGFDPLDINLNLFHRFESIYVNEYEEEITDYFELDLSIKVIGIADELDYLNSPKMYYSYLALENYMQEHLLLNLSTYYDTDISWYDRVMNAEDYSIISSYSYQLFLKDYEYRNQLFNDDIFGDYSFNSMSLVISNSLMGFMNAAEYALFLFLAIGLLGTLLILTIISFTNYSEDRKISAILTSLGAKESDIENIYVNENLYSGLFSLVFSFGISFPLSILINHLIKAYVGVQNIVSIPFLSFLSIPFLYPLIALLVVFVLIGFATILPIKFSKRTSLSLELKTND